MNVEYLMSEPDYSMERLSAFIDGELPPAEAQEIAAALEQNAALAATIAAMQQVDMRYAATFASTINAPIPDTLQDIVAVRRSAPGWVDRFRVRLLAPVGAAFALGLAVAAIAPSGLMDRTPSGPLAVSPALHAALDQAQSGVPFEAADVTVRVRLSFLSSDGQYCRHFMVDRSEAVACKSVSGWTYDAVARGNNASPLSGYGLASDSIPAAISDAIAARGVQQALTATGEAQAAARNWIHNQ